MPATLLTIEAKRFSKQNIIDVIRDESRGGPSTRANDQVRYLAAYLAHEAAAVQTIVVERPYVDRHYLEEYSRYYATALRAPAPHATRLHFFTEQLSQKTLSEILAASALGEAEYLEVRDRLQKSYFGFSVIRPIPSAPLGRTVVRSYADQPSRLMLASYKHSVHLCGIELSVLGVPFQQQELAVGACATTAVWSALAVASRATGRRAPTPFDVTDSATRHLLNDRPFPADSGLDLQQVLASIRAHGLAPYALKPGSNPQLFSMAVKAHLSSGMPVVLLVHEPSGYHALTAVGFREREDALPVSYYGVPDDSNHQLRSAAMSKIYVHEDRLGPYARMTWTIASDQHGDGVRLCHERFPQAEYAYGDDAMHVYAAIVPLYPKLRLSSMGLLKAAGELVPVLRRWLGDQFEDVTFEARFQLSGDYLKEILQLSLDPPGRAAKLSSEVVLPRFVARARFFVRAGAFLDAVFDTTDVLRHEPPYSRLVALVALAPSYSAQATAFVRSEAPHAVAV